MAKSIIGTRHSLNRSIFEIPHLNKRLMNNRKQMLASQCVLRVLVPDSKNRISA